MSIKNGDIVISKLQFEDGTTSKPRYCLVVNNTLIELIEVYNITTKEKKHIQTNKMIKATSSNGLKQDSYVKTNKIFKISKSNILDIVGNESNWQNYL